LIGGIIGIGGDVRAVGDGGQVTTSIGLLGKLSHTKNPIELHAKATTKTRTFPGDEVFVFIKLLLSDPLKSSKLTKPDDV
jgi:hypothetical protein